MAEEKPPTRDPAAVALLEGSRGLEEVAFERLQPRQGPEVLEGGAAKGWHDLDGDGKNELVLADPLGKIEIVSGGGTKVQRLKLEDGPAFAHLWDLRPMLEAKDAAWLAVWMVGQGGPEQPSRMALTAQNIFLPGETEHFLVVLDRSGRRTHQRQLGQEALQLHAVLPPAGPGQPGTLLCQVGSRLVRYEVRMGR